MLRNFAILLIFTGCLCRSERQARDSYLDAYAESHGTKAVPQKTIAVDRESGFPPYPGAYGPPDNHFTEPVAQYGGPHEIHYKTKVVYGPPPYGHHGPHHGGYHPIPPGPPLPPLPPQPPHYQQPQPFYGIPYGFFSLVDKIKYKLDILTILKIILKLIIFKKIVHFIALICLLLFIPTLKAKKKEVIVGTVAAAAAAAAGAVRPPPPLNDDDDEDDRSFHHDFEGFENMTLASRRIMEAIDKYSALNNNTSSL